MATEVLLDRFQIDSVLSRCIGKRSLIAQDRYGGQVVFLREFDLREPRNLERLERLKRQAVLLKQLNNPRIPALLDWVQTEDKLLLVSHYVPGQNLAARLAAGWKPQENDALAIAEQLLQILCFFQTYSLTQLTFSLRPDKLLIDSLDRIWLTDFGGLQPNNLLQDLGACLIHLLTGRPPEQLPVFNGKPAYQGFVPLSGEFSRWLDELLLAGPGLRADSALESLWKLLGKTWQPPLAQPRGRLRQEAQAQPAEGPWPLNSLIEDNYRLQQLLGQGQGSWKYLARNTALKQDVMLKLLPLADVQSGPGQEAWLELARRQQQLQHPQIPRFLRAFVTRREGQPYLTLAHVHVGGETLKDKFDAGWRPVAAELWDQTRQLLKVLDYVHVRGQAHGNLNPANVVVNKFGRVWLIDFSLLQIEPARDLYDLAATLIFLLSGARPGEFLAGCLHLRFADGKPFPSQLESWLQCMLQASPGQEFRSAADALSAFEQALLAVQPAKAIEVPAIIQVPAGRLSKGRSRNAALPWEVCVEQLRSLGLRSQLLQGGGIGMQCPESKELSQWNRSKTIGLLASPLRLIEEIQEQSRQKSRFFPLSGHRLEISPEDIRLIKEGTTGSEHELLAMGWSQLLEARLLPAPPKLLEALKHKVMPPAGTNFRLFHLQLSNQAMNSHCLMFLPPKAIPPLTKLIHQQLAGCY